jgi:SAM-dependent methyltransferase
MDRNDPAWKGQSEYTPLLLRLYDPLVLGPIARFVWRIPAHHIADHYRHHIQPGHLDVGPGTGAFILRSGLSAGSAVTILDPNPNVLVHCRPRLAQFDLTAVEADVLKPLPLERRFSSAALNLVIHCLPGPAERKAKAVEHIAAVLEPDGVLFGTSVLGTSGHHTPQARLFLKAFNWNGGFDNLDDSESMLADILGASFEEVTVGTIGSAALFSARGPRRSVVEPA